MKVVLFSSLPVDDMSEALHSSSPYQSWGSPDDSSDRSESEKDPVSSTDGNVPLFSEHEDGEISLSLWRLIALTCGIGGLQVIWSVILSQGAPFLVSIGLSKSLTALVWIAGPFCGAFVQPIVGYISDRSRISWGQRRPFIIVGAASTVFSILMLGWSESSIEWVVLVCHLDIEKDAVASIVIAFAVFWIYVLNISIQPLQVGLRALVVENCPSHQQAQANAWASFMTGAGNILGYLVGFSPLPGFIDSLCQTQFQGLCLLASFAVATTAPITCCFIHERSPELFLLPSGRNTGVLVTARRLFQTFRTKPLKIRRVLRIQFLAWIGWFPYLFYATTTRVGTFATFLSAIVALAANILVQFITRSISNSSIQSKSQSQHLFIRRFTIYQIWTSAHVSFAILMFSTFLVKTHIGGTVLIALSGASWAMTLWVPYAIIGQELATKQSRRQEIATAELESSDDNQAGLIMSLHNTAISIPQIAAALACSGIFWISNLAGSQDGAGWCLRAGGLAALAAAWESSDFGEN
ncbi:hypothetical protein BDZ45DRAFT_713925 [Acephala macrosclerotiorum]|nr:hypothetical protein BDZ45DRAFT_713925 [Acephala macrosclerotiorum]